MLRLHRLFIAKEFIRFLLVGGFAALVNFLSRIYYNLHMNFSQAIIIAYLTGMVTAYTLNKFFVFAPSQHHPIKEIIYFSLVNVAALAQTWLVSMILFYYGLDWLSSISWDVNIVAWKLPNFSLYKQEIAHFIGISVPVFTSYIGHKHLTFKAQ